MVEITKSRLAMYQALIAFAWAESEPDHNVKRHLHDIIDANPNFSIAQRRTLHADVDRKIELWEVWSNISDVQDRVDLFSIATGVIFKDGKLTDKEKNLYDSFMQKHLDTLGATQVEQEIREMSNQSEINYKDIAVENKIDMVVSYVKKSILYLMLGLSPIGIVVPFLIFAFSDICKGALGSGLRCELPFAAEYVEAVALYFEISFMFLIGFVWLFVAFRVWYKFFVNVAGFIQSLFFKPF